MKYELVKYPDERLYKPTIPVTEFNAELHELLDEMKRITLEEKGLGISANQCNSNLSVFLATNLHVYGFKPKEPDIVEFINPVILEQSKETVYLNEGCLSLPEVFIKLHRPAEVTVRAQKRNGEEFTVVCHDLEAVLVRHEMDHLESKFFLDHLSRQQRRAALKGIK